MARSSLSLADVNRLLKLWPTAGLDDAALLAELESVAEKTAVIARDYQTWQAERPARAGNLARQVCDGSLELADAIVVFTERGERGHAIAVVDACRSEILRRCTDRIRARGPALFSELLEPRSRAIFDAATKPAETLGDLEDPDAVFAMGAKATGAWHNLAALADADDALAKVAALLAEVLGVNGEWTNPRPDKYPPARRRPHKTRYLADLVLSGVGARQLIESTDVDMTVVTGPGPRDAA